VKSVGILRIGGLKLRIQNDEFNKFRVFYENIIKFNASKGFRKAISLILKFKKQRYVENWTKIEELDELNVRKLVYEWIVFEDYKPFSKYDDIAEAYRVYFDDRFSNGCIIKAKYNGEWKTNPWTVRPLIRHLIEELNDRSTNAGSAGSPNC
jgi:hypothetical protein